MNFQFIGWVANEIRSQNIFRDMAGTPTTIEYLKSELFVPP